MQHTGHSNYMKTGYDGQFKFFEKLKLCFLKTIDFEKKTELEVVFKNEKRKDQLFKTIVFKSI